MPAERAGHWRVLLCVVAAAACTQDGPREAADGADASPGPDVPAASGPAPVVPETALPGYAALPDSVVEAPTHTQVERRLIISEPADEAQLEALLRREFDAVMNSGPYRHHERPTHIYIRIYDSEQRSRRPALWSAMLRYGPGVDEPVTQTENPVLERELRVGGP